VRSEHVSYGLLRYKAKSPGLKKPFLDGVAGSVLFRELSKWVHKIRIVDRRGDHYLEEVVDTNTGEVIHRCDEPLSKHQGHGSAKKR
jgi:hypothetical protein